MCLFQSTISVLNKSEINEILYKSYNDLLLKRVGDEMTSLIDDLNKKFGVHEPDVQKKVVDDDDLPIKTLRKRTDCDNIEFNAYDKHYLTHIIEFFKIHKKFKSWKVLNNFVAEKLDGKFDICPITGKTISKMNFESRIKGCLTEHSSDSRQHYFRNGLLQPEGWRRNFFKNSKLRAQNEECNWKPYSTGGGGGTWRLGPGDARPSQKVLEDAAKLYKVKGYRRGTGLINDNKIYNAFYSNM